MESVPVGTPNPAPEGRHAVSSPNEPNRHNKQKKKVNKLKLGAIVAGAVLLLSLAFGGWLVYQSSTAAHINSGKYQAVFFTNGQVYFGKLQKLNGSYFKLTDVFYLEAKNTDDNNNTNSKNPQETSSQQSSDVQLIKLGSEVHGPDDEMIISQEQILFFENLKKDGKVSSSIDQYNNSKK